MNSSIDANLQQLDRSGSRFSVTACGRHWCMALERTSTALSVSCALMIAATLTGCSTTAPFGLPPLSEDQQASDKLPRMVAESASLDPSTSRLLASADGLRYFAAESASSDDVCFVVYESADAWVAGCSTGLPIGVTLMQHPEVLLSTYVAESDDWKPLGEYVVIRKE